MSLSHPGVLSLDEYDCAIIASCIEALLVEVGTAPFRKEFMDIARNAGKHGTEILNPDINELKNEVSAERRLRELEELTLRHAGWRRP